MPSKPMSASHRLVMVGALAGGAGPADIDERLVLVNMLLFARLHVDDDGQPTGIQYRGGVQRLALPFRKASTVKVPQDVIDYVDAILERLESGGYITLVAEAVPPKRRGTYGSAAHWRINL